MIRIVIVMLSALMISATAPQTSDYRVIDGDTIAVGKKRLRLGCIDAPEMDQPGGEESKQALIDILYGKPLKYRVSSTDRYGRDIVTLVVDDYIVNNKMVELGHAWWYEYYCKENTKLGELQQNARANKLGLWKDPNPMNPYRWRKK
jgi:micrococcal nuclease